MHCSSQSAPAKPFLLAQDSDSRTDDRAETCEVAERLQAFHFHSSLRPLLASSHGTNSAIISSSAPVVSRPTASSLEKVCADAARGLKGTWSEGGRFLNV